MEIFNGIFGKTRRWSNAVVPVNVQGTPITNVDTYCYQSAEITPAATATDVIQLLGSATKLVKVTSIAITAYANSADVINFYAYKRTTPNTGGTFASQASAIVSHDSQSPTASGVVNLYSANPSALGAGRLIGADRYELPATTGNAYSTIPWVLDFGIRNTQPIILRGSSESVSISLNGQTLPTGTKIFGRIEWTEETDNL